ncbi:uncharacterized protein LOC111269849 isoform X1 [Varroa jacobsoni]|uniref:uncharacterized protein LOC111269849 isoform X1 n=1 Tax=Varroa jacobsoni TaxID=62625 RepID=UPI000BF5CEBF|nr:uncharacterized protein LOC111269849 isoform X1 [Varroa jacobsoni]XP_022705455.1 uncharacterized protein LOC111269849 isoform X1 [Varroa jacobsoni]XP_022705456.1 uncharacterized protein LOC111269849 isoform X1 [Varroa jacobsoni]
MADAGAQRSCCIKNQWRLRNAEKTLETLEDIYQKSEGEIRELQQEEQALQALCSQSNTISTPTEGSVVGSQLTHQLQSANDQQSTVPLKPFVHLNQQLEPAQQDLLGFQVQSTTSLPHTPQTDLSSQTLQALTNDQQATDDDNDPDQRATYWMDQYYDLDYDSSEEKNKTSLAVSDTQKKRNIYTSFNHSGFLKTDEEINKMVMFPETDIRRKIKLYSSDSEDNSE